MPYRPRKRSYKRKPGYVRSAFARKAHRAITVGRRRTATNTGGPIGGVAALNMRTGGFLGIELKFYDTDKAATALVSAANWAGGEMDPATYLCLSAPAQGDSQSQRNGRQIVVRSVQGKGTSHMLPSISTDVDLPVIVFVALVLDTQTNGAQLNSEDVFADPVLGETSVVPFMNLQFAPRFRVLKTARFKLSPMIAGATGAVDSNGDTAAFSLFWRGIVPVNFTSGTTEGIANVMDNSFHVLAHCSNTNGAPTLAYQARIRFEG